MSEVEKLNDRQAKLDKERSELKLQIAALHGSVEHSDQDVLPTREPADKRQAELSEAAQEKVAAASPDAPADPADDSDEVKEARGDGEPEPGVPPAKVQRGPVTPSKSNKG